MHLHAPRDGFQTRLENRSIISENGTGMEIGRGTHRCFPIPIPAEAGWWPGEILLLIPSAGDNLAQSAVTTRGAHGRPDSIWNK